ncbi:MAG: HlyD family efflux transporter periplasmic adaptor subunit [Burkholderiaceae bacterium]|nr:HlyD family efflux transporter periplasmic adaptor subunit [Burkholderiaceae bacterium]
MTEQTKKIILPPHLLPRLEAFRIVKDGEQSYVLRDKLHGESYDFDAWQFFILEVLPGCETLQRLQTAFQDRFDRALTEREIGEFFAAIADRGLFDESAAQHPLLAPYMQVTYRVEDGRAIPKAFAAAAAADAAAPAPAPRAAGPDPDADLPAGVQDALGLDWRTTTRMLGLFDPRPMFRVLGPVLRPLKYITYIVPLLLLAAIMLVYQHSELVVQDLAILAIDKTLVEHLLFVFVTVHLVTTLTAGLVADSYKVAVEKVGVTLTMWVIPRWVLKMVGADRLNREQAMWLHGSTLIARMVMLSAGVLIWFNTRDTDSGFATFGLLLGLACAAGLVLESGNPLVKANGYYLLSAFLNEPHLRGKAFAALLNKFKGGVYRAADNNLLALYALASATYVVFLLLLIGVLIARFLVVNLDLGGSGIIIVAAFLALMVWRNYTGLKQFGETYAKKAQFDRWRSRTLPSDVIQGEVKSSKKNYWTTAAIVCLILLLFIPYTYEAGGPFVIYPTQKQVVSTDESGLVEAVYFEGGESVKQGTVIARLAKEDYAAQIKVLNAKIDEQAAVLRNLETLPRPEEVKLAEQDLELQRTREAFSREKVPRLEKMYKVGAVSFEEYDAARKDHMTDVQQVAQKQAQLALVKAPVTPSQIEAAEAKLASLKEERATYEAKLERTVLRMPFDGNILTLHLKDKVNSFLEKGAPFAALEYTGIVTAEIDVPEPDIEFVKIGAAVRLRPASFYDDKEFVGKVTTIDRNVTTKSTGNVIKVIATIENRDSQLKTGMTGRAKVDGVSMPVWQAFSRSIARFFKITVWSWIP